MKTCSLATQMTRDHLAPNWAYSYSVVGKYTIAEHEWKQAAFSRGKVDEWEYTWRGRTLNRGSINLWRGKNEQQ